MSKLNMVKTPIVNITSGEIRELSTAKIESIEWGTSHKFWFDCHLKKDGQPHANYRGTKVGVEFASGEFVGSHAFVPSAEVLAQAQAKREEIRSLFEKLNQARQELIALFADKQIESAYVPPTDEQLERDFSAAELRSGTQ